MFNNYNKNLLKLFSPIWSHCGKFESNANPRVIEILSLVFVWGCRMDIQSKICPDYARNLKLSKKVE